MPLRTYTYADDPKTDDLRREHSARAFQQWRRVSEIHFWLIGTGSRDDLELRTPIVPGAHSGNPLTRQNAMEGRRIAQQELSVNGWSLDTIRACVDYARSCEGGKVIFNAFGSDPKEQESKRRRSLAEDYSPAANKPRIYEHERWIPTPTIERDRPLTFNRGQPTIKQFATPTTTAPVHAAANFSIDDF